MEYAMRIIILVGEQIFCSWLFHTIFFMSQTNGCGFLKYEQLAKASIVSY